MKQNMGIPDIQTANRAHPNAPGIPAAVRQAAQQHAAAEQQQAHQAVQQQVNLLNATPGSPATFAPAAQHRYAQNEAVIQQADAKKGGLLNQIVPGTDTVLANAQGLHGSLQRGAAGL